MLISSLAFSGANIGFGTVKGIKVYNNATPKFTKVYLNSDATNMDVPECNGAATITHQNYASEPAALNQMISIVLAAYMSGKKIRLLSSDDNECEATFIAIQENYF